MGLDNVYFSGGSVVIRRAIKLYLCGAESYHKAPNALDAKNDKLHLKSANLWSICASWDLELPRITHISGKQIAREARLGDNVAPRKGARLDFLILISLG